MRFTDLEEEFRDVARLSTSSLVNAVLASQGFASFDKTSGAGRFNFNATPEFIDLLGMELQVNLYGAEHRYKKTLPVDLRTSGRIHSALTELAIDCLRNNDRINLRLMEQAHE